MPAKRLATRRFLSERRSQPQPPPPSPSTQNPPLRPPPPPLTTPAPDPAPPAAAPPVLPRDAPAPGAAPPLPARLLHSRPDPPADANPAPPPPHPPAAPQPLPLAAEHLNPPPPAPLPGFPNPSPYPSTSLPSPALQTATATNAIATAYPSTNPSSPQVLLPTTSTPPAPLPQLAAAPASHTSSSSPHPNDDTMPQQRERNNVTAASTNKGQTENYVTPANSNLSIPVSPNSQHSANNLQLTNCPEIKYDNHKEDNLPSQAIPAIPNQQPANLKTWTFLPSHDLKELRKAINDGGISSSYFKQLLKSTLERHTLTPHDCKHLATTFLTDSQYILWDLKWKRMLAGVLTTYRQSTDAHLRTLTLSKLTGDPPDDKIEHQANLPKMVLDDVKRMARRAFLQIQPAGTSEEAYNLVTQGSSEPFTTFVDRVIQATERQCGDDLARPIMIRDILENNANAQCKRIIKALGKEKPTVPEMIEACNYVGSPHDVAVVQAHEPEETRGDKLERALAAQAQQAEARDQRLTELLTALHLSSQQQYNTMAVMQAALPLGPCYLCKKPGHIVKDCTEVNKSPQTPDSCTTCKKGKHMPWQCRSKQDASRRPNPKNSKASAPRHRVMKQMVAPQNPEAPGALWRPPSQQPS
ncbi:uncharacterized protein [Taeniopygia guttata]|uniref:uncharacterized protein n=1 Tax=Taeniopygia guttata TaxID=59729 RepID=UPI003BB98426